MPPSAFDDDFTAALGSKADEERPWEPLACPECAHPAFEHGHFVRGCRFDGCRCKLVRTAVVYALYVAARGEDAA